MLLKDRVAVITGGSSGIGRGICLEFAREGARVVVADVQEAPKRGKYHEQETATPTVTEVKKLGAKGLFVPVDISDEAGVRGLVERTVQHFGGLDILVNNAGIHIPGSSQELSVADWDRVVGLNLRGIFLATKFAVPHLKRSKIGRIINIASIHAFGGGGGPAYAPAKAGVVNLTRDTAVELGRDNITVNAICPGYIETAIQDYLTPEQIEACRSRTPLPRLGLPKDIGRASVFLASEDAGWITGVALTVDGGWRARVG
ncbi:MAG: glucose 1-dehydrogenase [Candidatus Latescibacteria bacterium]|nr:glucose 1-dehydrogenase [Candidatus Latescibacterota bacterium]